VGRKMTKSRELTVFDVFLPYKNLPPVGSVCAS